MSPARAAIATLAALAALACSVLLAGCGDGVPFTRAASEPVLVAGGQFFPGAIPADTGGPQVLAPNSQNNVVFAGQAGKKLTGDATKGATSLAVRLEEVGSGYWIVPVGDPDPQTESALTWEADCDFSARLHPGPLPLSPDHPHYHLQLAAGDGAGAFGPVTALGIYVLSPVPAGKVVISLAWDSAADLDLHLTTPEGKEVYGKSPTTSTSPITDPTMIPASVGVLDRDSNAQCVQDNFREEDVVFQGQPPPGVYLVRVDMFAACGAPAADFVLTVRVDGAVTRTVKGRLLDLDADGGGPGAGLFVANLPF